MADPIDAYDDQAEALSALYEAVDPTQAFEAVLDLLPDGVGRIALDIGAGSGRDGAWLASKGYDVVAAEPSAGMRRVGRSLHSELRWIDDRLPGLQATHALGLAFDLVLLSAVWMHVKPTERARAFRKLTVLLKPGGLLILTLRHGPPPHDRPMYEVTAGEVESLARSHGMAVYRNLERHDELGRSGVRWTIMAIGMPDDGSVGLPLVRGLILGDSKSSTYKLGLLRAVAKVADAASALAVPHGTEADNRPADPRGHCWRHGVAKAKGRAGPATADLAWLRSAAPQQSAPAYVFRDHQSRVTGLYELTPWRYARQD